MSATALVAAVLTGLTTALAAALLVPPTPRLAGRVRPYTLQSRIALGAAPDVLELGRLDSDGGTLRRLFGPPLRAAASRIGRLLDTTSDQRLALALRQAGLLSEVPEPLRVQEYRVRQLGAGVAGAAVGVALPALLGASAGLVLLTGAAGMIVGVARPRARLDRALDDRRARMRIELYTVDQLLAMHVRVGGGVIQAVTRIVERGRGVVVEELSGALRAHASGLRAADAFARIAALTPEPHAARTYKLLATGAEWGADLGAALLALAEDVRDARREALRRAATRRRAAMLAPIIGLLAPVMLLFIAAPLPSLIFGAR